MDTTITTITTMNLKDGTCVVMEARRTFTLQDYSGKVLRTLTIDEAKALLEADEFF